MYKALAPESCPPISLVTITTLVVAGHANPLESCASVRITGPNKSVTTTALLARAAFPGTSGALTNGVIGVLEDTCTAITVAVAQVVLAVVRSSILTNPISTESTMSNG